MRFVFSQMGSSPFRVRQNPNRASTHSISHPDLKNLLKILTIWVTNFKTLAFVCPELILPVFQLTLWRLNLQSLREEAWQEKCSLSFLKSCFYLLVVNLLKWLQEFPISLHDQDHDVDVRGGSSPRLLRWRHLICLLSSIRKSNCGPRKLLLSKPFRSISCINYQLDSHLVEKLYHPFRKSCNRPSPVAKSMFFFDQKS